MRLKKSAWLFYVYPGSQSLHQVRVCQDCVPSAGISVLAFIKAPILNVLL